MILNESNLIAPEGEQSQRYRTVDMVSKAKRTKWKSMWRRRLQQSRWMSVVAIAAIFTVMTDTGTVEILGMINPESWREVDTMIADGTAEDREMTADCIVTASTLVHVATDTGESKE